MTLRPMARSAGVALHGEESFDRVVGAAMHRELALARLRLVVEADAAKGRERADGEPVPLSVKGVRLAQKMQVGPCIPVGIQL